MSTALPFQYDAVDAVSMEHMGQKQAGGPPPMIATCVRVAIFMSIEPKRAVARRKVVVAQMRKPVSS
jgi:hypothetical protein